MKTKKKKNGKKVVLLVSKLLFIVLLSLIITLMIKVMKMDVLPLKYLILVTVVFTLVLLFLGFFIFKKKIKYFLKFIAMILEIIAIGIMCYALSSLGKTVEFLNNIKNKLYQTEEFYLVTLNESTLSKLDDITGKTIGVYKDEINGNYNNLIIDFLNNNSVLLNEYDDYMQASEALLNKKVEVIFISANYKSLVEDENEDFAKQTKIINKSVVKIEAGDIAKEVSVSKEPFNVYISGIDTYGSIETVSRSDVNMVVTVNPDTKEVLLTSIPRDYYVQLHDTTGYKDKLTHAGMYGIKMSVTTIEDLLDIDINYYVRLNFSTLKKLVNAIGGITINSPAAFTSKVNKDCTFKKGKNTVKGACALAFARERYAFDTGDVQRVKNQQEVIRAIVDKAMTSKTIISKYSKILDSFGGSFETNMPKEKIYELIKMQLATMPTWSIEGQDLKGYDDYQYTYTMGRQELYVMMPDEKSVDDAISNIKKLMKKVSEQTATGK